MTNTFEIEKAIYMTGSVNSIWNSKKLNNIKIIVNEITEKDSSYKYHISIGEFNFKSKNDIKKKLAIFQAKGLFLEMKGYSPEKSIVQTTKMTPKQALEHLVSSKSCDVKFSFEIEKTNEKGTTRMKLSLFIENQLPIKKIFKSECNDLKYQTHKLSKYALEELSFVSKEAQKLLNEIDNNIFFLHSYFDLYENTDCEFKGSGSDNFLGYENLLWFIQDRNIKSNKGSTKRKSLGAYLTGFLNSKREGSIFFGINDDKKIVGVQLTDEQIDEILRLYIPDQIKDISCPSLENESVTISRMIKFDFFKVSSNIPNLYILKVVARNKCFDHLLLI